MNSEDAMQRLNKEVQVVSTFVGILSTPFAGGTSTLGSDVGTLFPLVVIHVTQVVLLGDGDVNPTYSAFTLVAGNFSSHEQEKEERLYHISPSPKCLQWSRSVVETITP